MEEKSAQQALMDLALDSAKENKQHADRWFKAFIISNVIWAVVVSLIVISFLYYESQFEYDVETNETTVTQNSGEGEGNNIYQSGEHATYNEGGEMNGDASNKGEENKSDSQSQDY